MTYWLVLIPREGQCFIRRWVWPIRPQFCARKLSVIDPRVSLPGLSATSHLFALQLTPSVGAIALGNVNGQHFKKRLCGAAVMPISMSQDVEFTFRQTNVDLLKEAGFEARGCD